MCLEHLEYSANPVTKWGPIALASLIWGNFPFSSFQKPLAPSSILSDFSPNLIAQRKAGTRAISPQTSRLPLYSTNAEGQMWPRLLPAILSGISIYIEFNYAIKVIFLS